jgi:hypothetical protein
MKLDLSGQILENAQISNLMKIRLVGFEVVNGQAQTDGR